MKVKTVIFAKGEGNGEQHMMQKTYGRENHENVIKIMALCGWRVIKVLG